MQTQNQIQRYASLISQGRVEPLELIPFHSIAPIERRLMAGQELHAGAECHIAVHSIRDLPQEHREYCLPHRHNCPEINLILSFDRLVYRVTLDDEVYVVEAPASIFIPRGLLHSAVAIEGEGFFVAILKSGNYLSSLLREYTSPCAHRPK